MLEVSLHYFQWVSEQICWSLGMGGYFFVLNPCIDQTHLNSLLLTLLTSDVKKKQILP